MKNQELGDYLKSKAKSSGDFIPIYLPSAYHTLDVLTHFFFQKKHEWIAFCFLDRFFQCHAIWLEKGKNVNSVNPSISKGGVIKFSKLNNFKHVIMAHNHTITSDDISYFRSYGININSSIDVKRQQFLKFSEGDKVYAKLWLEACKKEDIGFISAVIVGGEFHIEGHQNILDNIEVNKPKFRSFRSNTIQSNFSNLNQHFGFKQLKFKADERTSKTPEYKGYIGYFDLNEWWNQNFSLEEQNYIAQNFNKKRDYSELNENRKLRQLSGCRLMEAKIGYTSESLLQFVTSLHVGINNKRNREISLKIIEKTEELITPSTPIIDLHFFYSWKFGNYFSLSNLNNKYYFKSMEAYEQQQKISHLAAQAFSKIGSDGFIPSHPVFKRMAIVMEKEKKFEEAISICQKAQVEGWNGDWQKRIERCMKKLSKL